MGYSITNTICKITVVVYFLCLLILDAKVLHKYLVFRNHHAEGYAALCFDSGWQCTSVSMVLKAGGGRKLYSG